MSKIQSFSSVVVTDYSDVGQLNLYLTCNQPTSVLYDPNQNTYTPDWSTSSLVVTPVISFNGKNVPLGSSGLSITYQRQEGSGTPTAITTGQTSSGGKLTVKANKLADISSKIITYICKVVYTDPNVNVPIQAQANISFTLVSNASNVKYCSITGQSAFLYDTNRKIVGNGTITLTANLTNVSVSQWQYKKADGSFAAFPTTNNKSITGDTLIVKDTESGIWMNDKTATIKLVTNDNDVYDLFNIVKLYDGAAGSDTVSAVLTNENHVLSVNSSGVVKSWSGASTQIHIYEGGEDVTSSWAITVSNGPGLTGTLSSDLPRTYTPTALTEDNGYADFTCTKKGYANIVKRYTIAKQAAGADGQDAVIYEVSPDVYAIKRSESGTYTPVNGVTFTAYTKVGDSASKSNYSGRFIISETVDGSTFTTKYTSASNEYSYTYKPSSNTVLAIKCALYKAGGTTVQLDEQTVVVTADGKTGQSGHNGSNGVSVVMGNDSDIIPCTSGGVAAEAMTINIPFYGYDGITKTPITCTPGTLPSGVTVKSNTAGTASAGGLLVLSVANGATFGNASSTHGQITLTFSCKGQSVEKKFSWTKRNNAVNGQNVGYLQIYSLDGGTIYNSNGSTKLSARFRYGNSIVSSGVTYTWTKYGTSSGNTGYVINAGTGQNITVNASDVDGKAWYKCTTSSYNGVVYEAYYTVNDEQDPVQSYTFSTVAQFKNSQGCGAIYTRVYQNGVELDPIRTTVFSTTAPSSPASGDFWYKLDTSSKTCTLMKYDGSKWATATETDSLTYKYYRTDKNGKQLDTTGAFKSTRAFYIDPSIVNGTMQFRCEVTGS